MMLRCGLAVFVTVCCALRFNEGAAQSSPAPEPKAAVYYAEDGIKAPKLAPTDFGPVISTNCEYEGVGIVRISLMVNTQGGADSVLPLYPFNDDIDKAAVSVAKADRFLPGSKGGVPVAVAQELEVKVTVCK